MSDVCRLLRGAPELVEQKVAETLLYYAFPSTHWPQIRNRYCHDKGSHRLHFFSLSPPSGVQRGATAS